MVVHKSVVAPVVISMLTGIVVPPRTHDEMDFPHTIAKRTSP
jgi:hypothetical protein